MRHKKKWLSVAGFLILTTFILHSLINPVKSRDISVNKSLCCFLNFDPGTRVAGGDLQRTRDYEQLDTV
jgi:hypothetical protein